MKRKYLAFVVVLLVLMQAISGCGETIVITQTEILTIPGPVTTTIQPVNVTGPVTTTTQTTTVPGPVTTTTQTTTATITATVTGPTTTVTQTKTGIPTQGINYISSISPASPGTLHFNDWVKITFEYVITDPGGARIWAIPTTNGQNTPNCSYSTPGLVPAGRGTASIDFTVVSGSVKINEIHLFMRDSKNTVYLFDAYVPVDFSYVP
jgi:hypothetical protein